MEIKSTSTGRYIEYLLATQDSWKIKGIDTRKRYTQIFKALRTNRRVKTLSIQCRLLGGPTNDDLFELANSIEVNDTLESLSLRYFVEDLSEGMTTVLAALTNKPKISALELTNLFHTESVWIALLDFLRAHPQLKRLSLYNADLSEEQVIELMGILCDYNTELTYLDVGGYLNSNSLDSLRAIAKYVSKSTKLKELELNEDELAEEVADQAIKIMQNNTSVVELTPRNGFFGNSDWFIRNITASRPAMDELPQERNLAPPSQVTIQPPETILMPDVTRETAIKKVSPDILREIFWQLSVKSLCTIRKVDKQFYNLTKDGNFWRGYYTKYFSCVPKDLLVLTDLTFGIKLATAEKLSTTIWEEIVTNSFRARNISAEDYPIRCGLPFMEPVYRLFPQLVGTKESEGSFSDDHSVDLPYHNTWFLMYANGAAIYHLGFEQLADGQINGILFFTSDFSEAFTKRFDYLEYVFEWFAAHSETEFAEKSKALCAAYLASHVASNLGFINGRCYTKIKPLLQDAIKSRQNIADIIKVKIESATEEYITKFDSANSYPNSAEFVQRVQNLIYQFKEVSCNNNTAESEIERLTQKLPPRTILNTKYPENNNKDRIHDFITHQWRDVRDERQRKLPHDPIHKPQMNRSKEIPKVVVMKFYRVAVNFIMMPVLKIFWPGDMDDTDYELAPFLRWQTDAMSLFKQLYYSGPYIPFSRVTVSSAHPSHWPLIALGLARQLMPFIIPALNDILDKSKDKTNIDKLIEVLDQLPVISQHVKSTLRRFAESQKE